MRLSLLTTLSLTGLGLAAPLQTITDVQFVLDGYKTILSNAALLSAGVTALSPTDNIPAKLQELSALSASTIAVTESLTARINATPGTLSAAAAAQLATPSQQVAASTVQIVDTLVAKKALFVGVKLDGVVKADLQRLYTVTEAFVGAAKAKVPKQFVSVASGPFQQLLDSLKKGINGFA